MLNTLLEERAYEYVRRVIKSALMTVAPGMYAILTSIANRELGIPFEKLILEDPVRAYEVVRSFLCSEYATDLLFKYILKKLLSSEGEAEIALTLIKSGRSKAVAQRLVVVVKKSLSTGGSEIALVSELKYLYLERE